MKGIDEFKTFVRGKPSLVRFVNNGEMSWQKFYDMWYLYGANHDIWGKYNQIEEPVKKALTSSTTLKDLSSMFQNLDLESVRSGIDGLQKAIGIFLDLGSSRKSSNSSSQIPVNTRQPHDSRAMFRRFED